MTIYEWIGLGMIIFPLGASALYLVGVSLYSILRDAYQESTKIGVAVTVGIIYAVIAGLLMAFGGN